MIFPESDNHFSRIDPALYQRPIYDAAMKYVKGFGCAVDIGAHVGIFTKRMEEDFASVVAFEPEPENFHCLEQNCLKATKINRAVHEAFTVGKMISPKRENSGAWEFMPVGHIQAVPLDSFELDDVDLIKIDVQGCEVPVLRGAMDTLTRNKPVLIVECVSRAGYNEQIDAILKPLGYVPCIQINKDVVFAC